MPTKYLQLPQLNNWLWPKAWVWKRLDIKSHRISGSKPKILNRVEILSLESLDMSGESRAAGLECLELPKFGQESMENVYLDFQDPCTDFRDQIVQLLQSRVQIASQGAILLPAARLSRVMPRALRLKVSADYANWTWIRMRRNLQSLEISVGTRSGQGVEF